jgi:hypothetical protein
MFVKLLVLLFSNVFVSFSVLVCSRSFNKKCSLKVLVSAIEPKHDAIEHICAQAHEAAIECTITLARVTLAALAPSLWCVAVSPAQWEYQLTSN